VAGLVRSVRGARGGYVLAVEPRALSLAGLIRVVEGPIALVNCAPTGGGYRGRCERSAVCAIRQPVLKLHERLVRFLEGVMLADVAFDKDYAERHTPPRSGRALAR
jgi:Rrf2 family protein